MTPVLLTRPLPQAQEFAAQIAERFGAAAPCIISPVLDVVTLKPKIAFSEFSGLVFTSQNGVAAYRANDGPAGLVAYCVGDKTTRAAQEAGLEAYSAGGDVTSLNALLAKAAPKGPLLHPSGVHVAGQVDGNVTRVAFYDQRPIDLNNEALAALSTTGPLLVPIFSPRTAELLQKALPDNIQATPHDISLSQAVAEAIDPVAFRHISVCKSPTAAAMLDRLAEFFPV